MLSRIARNAFTETDCRSIEQEIVAHLRVSDAMKMPSSMPSEGAPLKLSSDQLAIVRSTISRFSDKRLRSDLHAHVEGAITRGAIVQV